MRKSTRPFALYGPLAAALVLAACSRDQARSGRQAADWPGYNNTYDGQRFAALNQINTGNVSQL
jgi:glucose dehydrogenase